MVVVDREGYQLYRHLLHSIYRLDICDYGPLDFDINVLEDPVPVAGGGYIRHTNKPPSFKWRFD